MDFLPKQIDFLRDFTTPIVAYVGGFGSGKSFATVHKAIAFSAVNPNCSGMLVSPTFQMLRDTTRKTFFEVLEQESISFRFRATENKILLDDSNSEVWFRSADDPDKLKGPNLAWVGMDEVAQMEKEAYTIALSRIRDPKAKFRQLFMSSTPEGFNWFYELFQTLDHDKKLIRSKSTENKHLPKEYLENLYNNYDALLVEQYINGEFVNINQGKVYYSFNRLTHCRPINYNPNSDVYITFDFNVNPMTTSMCQIRAGSPHEQKEVVQVFRVLNVRFGNTEDQCREIKRILYEEYGHQKPVHITGDASHPTSTTSNRTDWQIIQEHFPDANFFLRKNNPRVQDRVNSMNSKFKNSKGEVGVYIDHSCTPLIQDLEQVSWKSGTRDIDKSNRELTHNSDNLGYLIYNLYPIGGNQKTSIGSYR